MQLEVIAQMPDAPASYMRVQRGILSGLLPLARWQVQSLPGLYSSGVRYRAERAGYDSHADPKTVYRRGHGDCAHLALWRLAERLNETGWLPSMKTEPPWDFHLQFMGRNRRGARLFHVLLVGPGAQLEDPSIVLGMPVPK